MKKKMILAGVLLTAAILAAAAGSLFRDTLPPEPVRCSSQALEPVSLTAFELPNGPLDVNNADADELTSLPGIGPKLAEAIIEERTANGPFYFPEDLRTVKGIGEGKLNGIRELIFLPQEEEEE